MAPLNQCYSDDTRKKIPLHPGRAVTIRVPELYGAAILKAACAETAVNGLKNTGIFPLHPSFSSN
jgi:hypothetical protein